MHTGLINNAAYVPTRPTPFIKETEEYWNMILAVNLKGVILCCRAVLDTMIKNRSGKIVNIASIAGRTGRKNQALYAASKGGAIAFTKSLAQEMGRYNININSVCPGPTDTPATLNTPPEMKEEILRAIPLGRFGTPENVADVVAFLCSNGGAHMTGQAISVDGGYTMI